MAPAVYQRGDNNVNRSNDHHHRSEVEAPTHAEIAAMAHTLWLAEGQPTQSAERNWLDAERELKAGRISRKMIERAEERSGSVQA
jgi:hypothetical protein